MAAGARRLDNHPKLLFAAKFARELLPGDSRFGDPLSTGGDAAGQVAGRRLSALTAERPGVLREAGMSALQVWQALSERQGRGRGDTQLAILFTDLVDFSRWALEAGDEAALDLLRDVGEAIEPPVCDRAGRIVKRLGDGMMAVFADPAEAVEAVQDARGRLDEVDADGYRPRMRAGMHVGRPRHIGGDYLGVDVNIAARIAQQGSADELLVSERTLELLGRDPSEASVKRRLRMKGVPKDLKVYALK